MNIEFKIGDKVRITKHAAWTNLVGEICEVSKIEPLNTSFICRIKHKSNWDCLMLEKEIEKMPEKGKQLTFAFME